MKGVREDRKGEKGELEAKTRNLEEAAENHGRDKEQLDKLNKTVKDLKVRSGPASTVT